MIEFEPFPKIARLNRNIVITEKIDGTNAQIKIIHRDDLNHDVDNLPFTSIVDEDWFVFAGSRNRYVTPGNDNYGFANFVKENVNTLFHTLGEGTHYGEWWGKGIQRNYGLDRKVFSLFNVHRWSGIVEDHFNLNVVPTLYEGPYDTNEIESCLQGLRENGSIASLQFGKTFSNPEGIVIYHTASRELYKVTLENDGLPKGLVSNGNS